MRRLVYIAVLIVLSALGCSSGGDGPTDPGTPPACAVAPSVVAFGSVLVGAHRDTTITVTNVGGGTLSGSVAENCGDFSVVGSSSFSLTAGQSATFAVRFTPAAAGLKNCSLAAGAGCAVTLSGTGTTSPGTASCAMSPASLAFGSVPVGQQLDRTVRVTNTGPTNLSGSGSSPCSEFSIPGHSSYNLAPGQTDTLIVRYRPSAAGAQSCVLNFGPSCGTLACSGRGEESCVVTPRTLDFGQVRYHQAADQTFTVRNAGTTPLTGTIPPLRVLGFSLVGSNAYDLAPGGSATFTIRFAPTTTNTGPYGGAVDLGALCGSLGLSGSGTFGCDCLVSRTRIDFGNVTVGEESKTQSFHISNSSDQTISGAIRVLEGDFRTPASYVARPGVGQGQWVTFAPQRAGAQVGRIVFDRNGCTGPGEACDTLVCTGTGVLASPPRCGVSLTTIDMGTVYFGTFKDTTLTIRNLGGGTLADSVKFTDNSPPFYALTRYYSLGPGDSTSVLLRFVSSGTPGHVYSYVGNLSTGSQCLAQGLGIQVTGVAREAPAPPQCAISPTVLDFGTVAVGQTKDLTFDLRNSGGGTLCGSVTEACSGFSVTQNETYCITPPAFVRVTVRFSPASSGFQQCTVSPGSGCPSVTVRGTGS